jgi:hypothetical protein
VDLGDLKGEKENLSSFLHLKLKVNIVPIENKLVVDSESIPAQELQRLVIKFVYHRNLNTTHWASLEGKTVKINAFKSSKKPEKRNKNPTSPTFAHGF